MQEKRVQAAPTEAACLGYYSTSSMPVTQKSAAASERYRGNAQERENEYDRRERESDADEED